MKSKITWAICGHGKTQINLELENEDMQIKYDDCHTYVHFVDGRQSKELEEKHHLQERGPEALL